MKSFECPLAGMRHHVPESTRKYLSQKLAEKHGGLSAAFVRDPKNLADENAVEVWVTEKPYKNMKVGYVPRDIAKVLAPLLDDRVKFTVRVVSIDWREAEATLKVKPKKRKTA